VVQRVCPEIPSNRFLLNNRCRIFWWAWLTDPKGKSKTKFELMHWIKIILYKAGTWEVKNSYTPQNKPVISILTKYFKNN
jgi:hypothetical protein